MKVDDLKDLIKETRKDITEDAVDEAKDVMKEKTKEKLETIHGTLEKHGKTTMEGVKESIQEIIHDLHSKITTLKEMGTRIDRLRERKTARQAKPVEVQYATEGSKPRA